MATVTLRVRAYYENGTQLATCDIPVDSSSNYEVYGIWGAFVNATSFSPTTAYSRTAGSNLARVNYVSSSTYSSTTYPTNDNNLIGFKESGIGWFSFYFANPVQTYDINVKAYQWNNSTSEWDLLQSHTIEGVAEGTYEVYGVWGAFVNATGFTPPSEHIATTGTDYTGSALYPVEPSIDTNTITVSGADSYCYFYYEASQSSGKAHIYNGSNWVEATPYIYNGSNWVQATEYIYDGGWN